MESEKQETLNSVFLRCSRKIGSPNEEIKKKDTHNLKAASYLKLQIHCSKIHPFPYLSLFFSRWVYSHIAPRLISWADKVLVGFPFQENRVENLVKLTFLCCSEDKCLADPSSAKLTIKFTFFTYPNVERSLKWWIIHLAVISNVALLVRALWCYHHPFSAWKPIKGFFSVSIPLRKQTKETNRSQSAKVQLELLGSFLKVWYYFIWNIYYISHASLSMEFPYFHHLGGQLKYHDLLWTGKPTINKSFHTGTLTFSVHELLKFQFPKLP